MNIINRLEQAQEGSRDLDRAIWLALGNEVRLITETGRHQHERWIDRDGIRWPQDHTRFSTSLDAATSLIPTGWEWDIKVYRVPEGIIEEPQSQACVEDRRTNLPWGQHPNFHGKSGPDAPALAMAIAVVRARMSTGVNH